MKFNFEELISKISNKKSYLETMQMLANKKATLTKLNKFCDMCNTKLKLQSYIEVKAIKKSSENIYCDECGWCYNVSTNKDWYESDDNREIDYGDEW